MFTPDYQIELKSGVRVPLLFNSWTFKNYSLRNGFELASLIDEHTKCFKLDYLDSLLLTAAESYCKFNNKPFQHTEMDALSWIDDMGGYIPNDKNMAIFKKAMVKLFGVDESKLEVEYQQNDTGAKKETAA